MAKGRERPRKGPVSVPEKWASTETVAASPGKTPGERRKPARVNFHLYLIKAHCSFLYFL